MVYFMEKVSHLASQNQLILTAQICPQTPIFYNFLELMRCVARQIRVPTKHYPTPFHYFTAITKECKSVMEIISGVLRGPVCSTCDVTAQIKIKARFFLSRERPIFVAHL